MYADDTILYFSHSCTHTIQDTIQNDSTRLVYWFIANRLSLNPSKCKSMLVASHRSRAADQHLQLTLAGSELEQVETFKYLGVVLDNTLQWNHHFTHVTPMKLLPLRPRRSASPPPRSASPPQKICFAPVVPLRPRRNSALPPSFCLAPNGGTAHSRHENRLQNNNKGCAAKFKVAHAPTNILDHLSAKWRCTNPSHSKVYPFLTAHDFRVDCELCRHWGLSRRTGAKQNCAGGVEERRGRSRFFAGAKQNGAGAKQNGGGEEEGVSWGETVLNLLGWTTVSQHHTRAKAFLTVQGTEWYDTCAHLTILHNICFYPLTQHPTQYTGGAPTT
ncbi:hypothetical protein Bbelb_073170 [Branchiostoma belcheri]|nr:hypothetical protein Bbelb_073170 [Branchiostoma belcheri]